MASAPKGTKFIGAGPEEIYLYRGFTGNTNTHRRVVMKNPTFAPGKAYYDCIELKDMPPPEDKPLERRTLR